MGFFRLIPVIALILACPCFSLAQEASVSTDKQVYSRGEKIKITVQNVSKQSIFSSAASSSPDLAIANFERKLSQWSWDAFRLYCGFPECENKSREAELKEIKAGQAATFEWKPRVYSEKKYIDPKPGLCRMTFIYKIRKEYDPKEWIWKTVKSNEFTLE
jgi:hypothetical protein